MGVVENIVRAVGPRAVVLTDPAAQAGMRSDQSGIVGPLPLCTVRPGDAEDVRLVVSVCRDDGVPIVARGGGTGLEGGCVPVLDCVVIDTSSLDAILRISPEDRLATVGAGVTAERLNSLVAEHGLFFPVAPAGAAESATMGGMVSTNARGMHAVKYGSAGDNLLAATVVMADGTLARFGHDVFHSSSGLRMAALLAGAEGILGVITEVTVRLHPLPEARKSILLEFDNLEDAADVCALIAAYVPDAAAIEIVSAPTISVLLSAFPDAGFPPAGESLVMIELHGGPESIGCAADTVLDIAADHDGRPFVPPRGTDPWADRHRFTRAISAMSCEGRPCRFDAAVPLTRLTEYIRCLEQAAASVPGRPTTCIFGHAGAGIMHVLLPIGDKPGLWGTAAAAAFRLASTKTALSLGGTASGEHGIGLSSIGPCAAENAASIHWMRAVRLALDPQEIMNPGKVLL